MKEKVIFSFFKRNANAFILLLYRQPLLHWAVVRTDRNH